MNAIFKKVAWTALAAAVVAGPVVAQDSTLRADTEHSEGRIFLSSSTRPELQWNIGVVRVNGTVKEKAGSSPTAIDFTLYPADQQSDELKAGDRAQEPDATMISFHSKSVGAVDEHTYRATGDLTVTYVESIVTLGPSESYSGPVHGQATTHSVKKGVSIDFQRVERADAGGYTEWVATSTVTGRAFPELLEAVANTDWPEYVNNEQCSIPGNVGEDYSGPSCTGDVVAAAPRTDVRCEMPTTTGEGFGGEICEGTPLQAPSRAQLSSLSTQNGDTSELAGTPFADEVKLVVNLRMGESNMAIAGNAGN